MSPELRGRSGTLIPDFVDEQIRAEVESLQQDRDAVFDEGGYGDVDESDSEYDYFSDETPDEFDEADLQRLTRERGFGLGTWIDRLVEWTLFGVDEWPVPVSSAAATRIGASDTTTTVTFEDPMVPLRGDRGEMAHDTLSLASAERDREYQSDDADDLSQADGEPTFNVEKPGAQGGWEDAKWLFRVVKLALI